MKGKKAALLAILASILGIGLWGFTRSAAVPAPIVPAVTTKTVLPSKVLPSKVLPSKVLPSKVLPSKDAGLLALSETKRLVDAGPLLKAPPPVISVPRTRAYGLHGSVRWRRGGKGKWRRLKKGTALSSSDVIATGAGGRVALRTGAHVVQLMPGTEVKVAAVTEQLTRFLLANGLVKAKASGKRTLQIDATVGGASGRSQNGRFTMSHNGEGTVAVGVQSGRVRVSGGGSSVVLRKGQQTLVQAGRKPAPATPLARSLLLKVNWPKQDATNQPRLRLTGKTQAGALVFAMGKPVHVDKKGRFSVAMTLKEGENHPRIEARDVSGNHTKGLAPQIVLNTKGTQAEFETDTLWGK